MWRQCLGEYVCRLIIGVDVLYFGRVISEDFGQVRQINFCVF